MASSSLRANDSDILVLALNSSDFNLRIMFFHLLLVHTMDLHWFFSLRTECTCIVVGFVVSSIS